MSYIRLGGDLVSSGTVAASTSKTPSTSKCPEGEYWDTIDNVCVPSKSTAPAPTRTTSPLLTLRQQYSVQQATSAALAEKQRQASAYSQDPRCPTGERYDKIEQSCVRDPNYKPPTQPKPTISSTDYGRTATVAPAPRESGYSEPPPPAPTKSPIPESDGSSSSGAQTVNRTSSGSGSGSAYNYPSSGGSSVPPPSLDPVSVPDYEGAAKAEAAKPFYENPLVLLGGGALLAYLLLRKR